MIYQDATICAISTPPGNGGISLIRLSGPKAFQIIQKIFKSTQNINIEKQAGNTIIFGEILDNEQVIDEVLISVFKKPKSYTGENSIEISCHGSTFIQKAILELLIKQGAQLAQAGEFTQRAFLNGKMDLAQAESVADLIASENKAMHKIAIQQLKGGFSEELESLRSKMINFSALIELELDFSEEEVEFADRSSLTKLVETLDDSISYLIDSFSYGNAVKNGVPVAIVGRPNAGKSTLLNTLINEDRAIVSEIEGTTRDTIEENLVIQGVQFRFIDTAGLRESNDEIEKIGVERALGKIDKSTVYIYLFDASRTTLKELKDDLKKLNNEIPRIVIANKIDLLAEAKIKAISDFNQDIICISAKNKLSIESVHSRLLRAINFKSNHNNIVVTNIRHLEALTKAKDAVIRVNRGIKSGVETDLLAMDMRDASHFVGEITGNISTDELLGNIFQNFCIGK